MAGGTGRLYGREPEWATIEKSMGEVGGGNGRLLLIEGPVGVGKTSLLDVSRQRAMSAGFLVLSARGAALEQDLAFGIVMQLVDAVLKASPDGRHRHLVSTAAGFSALHRIMMDLADHGPVCLAVDDLHWADESSLGSLIHLARRLEGVPVMVLATAHPSDPRSRPGLLSELSDAGNAVVLDIAPLGEASAADLTRERLGHAEEHLVRDLLGATGGVPLYLCALLDELQGDGAGSARDIALTDIAPTALAHIVPRRLVRLPACLIDVARAVAVLGDDALARTVAGMTGLLLENMLGMVDALVAVDLLEIETGRPIRYRHPVLRSVVYEGIPSGERSLLHARAALLLRESGTAAERVARHLQSVEPGTFAAASEVFVAAANEAVQRGAAGSAIDYLSHALAEPITEEERAVVLLQLGRVEILASEPSAVVHLQQAVDLAGDPRTRADIAFELAGALVSVGRPDAATELLRHARDGVSDGDDSGIIESIEAVSAMTAMLDPCRIDEFDSKLPELRRLAARGTRASRLLHLVLAGLMSARTGHAGAVVALVDRALGPEEIEMSGLPEALMANACVALGRVDALDELDRLCDAMSGRADAVGSVLGDISSHVHRTLVHSRRGELPDAERHLRRALFLAEGHAMVVAALSAVHHALDAILERRSLADVADHAVGIELPPPLAHHFVGACHFEVRGRIALTAGDLHAGCELLVRSVEIFDTLRLQNPLVTTSRRALAIAVHRAEPELARRMLDRELEAAQRSGIARAVGLALGAAAAIERNADERLSLLEASAAHLTGANCSLDRARVLLDLGSTLRRSNQRQAARDPLRLAHDLARRCGADRLADSAFDELLASGAKPRRTAVAGIESLTPSEFRVARMAADGRTNKEIARALFVTTKTVETQLTHTYRKLAIGGRTGLSGAFGHRPLSVHEADRLRSDA